MGESTFSLWCADANLTANQSYEDETGWDFLVEFPYEDINFEDDLHKAALECRVQVKATDSTKRKIQIPLSNLRRLVTTHIPAFIIVLEFDGLDTAQRAFLVHIDRQIILKVLKRIYEKGQERPLPKLNRSKLTVLYGAECQLSTPQGVSLKSALARHIGEDLDSYISSKAALLKSAGYEEGDTVVEFTVEGKDQLAALVDSSIGIGGETELSHLSARKMRFGIESKENVFSTSNATLKMDDLAPTGSGTLRFREDKLSPAFQLDVDYFVTPFGIALPEEFRKIRIANRYFQLTMTPYIGRAQYTISMTDSSGLEVNEFRNVLKVMRLLATSERNIGVEFQIETGERLNFLVPGQNNHFNFSDELESLERISGILQAFGFTQELKITLAELSRELRAIDEFSTLLDERDRQYRSSFSLKDNDLDDSKDCACIHLFGCRIGSLTFAAFFVFIGATEHKEESTYEVTTKDRRVERLVVFESNDPPNATEIKEIVDEICKSYEKDFLVVSNVH